MYLVDTIGKSKDKMGHLKALVFIRPTPQSMRALDEELRQANYGEYNVFFANIVPGDMLRSLAESDEKAAIRQVQEYFLDYIVVEPHLFTLKLNNIMTLNKVRSKWNATEDQLFSRCVSGIISVLLSLKKRPVIRYQKSSELASSFAREVKYSIDKEDSKGDGLFDFRKDGTPPLLLILDRRDDPITPLLTQWTYQAMVHEIIGIDLNKVDLSRAKTSIKGDKSLVMSTEFDAFYKSNMYANFGEMGVAIKDFLEMYAKKSAGSESVNTIEDMQKFVDNYPEMKKMSNNVSKHVTIMGELAKHVEERLLMKVSELEQEMACTNDHALHSKALMELLTNPRFTSNKDALRLVMVYALRYETYGGNLIKKALNTLKERGLLAPEVAMVEELLAYAGAALRGSELFGDSSSVARVMGNIKRELKGVSNVYTQHKPLLNEIIDMVKRNKLKDSAFPYEGRSIANAPQDVIVFILGGVTYEESLNVAEINRVGGIRVVLGGTSVLNSDSFITEIAKINNPAPGERRTSRGGTTYEASGGGAGYAKMTAV